MRGGLLGRDKIQGDRKGGRVGLELAFRAALLLLELFLILGAVLWVADLIERNK